ncbi:MAG: hypothetical protein P4N59_07350 [Negativicutes bacterium]|nr:hypothetical protein [Negativicutes bacterium]
MKPVECLKAGLSIDQAEKLYPIDLNEADFVTLLEHGLTSSAIQDLYQFKSATGFSGKLKALGLYPLPAELKSLANKNRSAAISASQQKRHASQDAEKPEPSQPVVLTEAPPAPAYQCLGRNATDDPGRSERSREAQIADQIIIRLVKDGKGHLMTVDGYTTARDLLKLAADGYDGVSIPAAQGAVGARK